MTANAAILGLGFLSATVAAPSSSSSMRRDFEHRRRPERRPRPRRRRTPSRALREVISRTRRFWRFMVLLALLSLVRMMFQHMHFTWPKYVTASSGDGFPVGTVWSLNSLLILGLAPLGTAITRKRKPLTCSSSAPSSRRSARSSSASARPWPSRSAMILVLTVGEALWSPRLYEYNVSIAPRGREATYVSLASLPYFLAKFLVGPTSGYLLSTYCPADGPRNGAILWAIIGMSTMLGPVGIFLLRGWIGRKDAPVEGAPAAAA